MLPSDYGIIDHIYSTNTIEDKKECQTMFSCLFDGTVLNAHSI